MDYIANYGGVKLVDELRKTEASRLNSKSGGKDWYQQTPEERHYNRTIRSPWWARVTKNTLDLATYTLPGLLYERQAEQGSDYSVLFPNNVLAPAGASPENRQALQRAVNRYHADIYRKYSDRLTPVAGIPLTTPQEGIEELEFAVKTLGLKVINITGGVKRPIKAIADKYPADKFPEIAKYASYIDFYGLDSEYDYDPFWAKVIELGVPVTTHYGSQGWTGRSSTSNYCRIYSWKAAAARSETTGIIVDAVTNITSSRLFARLGFERRYLNEQLRREIKEVRESNWYSERIRWFQFISAAILKISTLYYSLGLWSQGVIATADFVVATSLSLLIISEARNLSRRFLEFFEHIGNVANGVLIIVQPHELIDRDRPLNHPR